jgi:hypothetical protein
MTISKRRKRTVKKMILPLLAVGLMMLMMYIGRPNQPVSSYKAPANAAARTPHGLHTR